MPKEDKSISTTRLSIIVVLHLVKGDILMQ